MTKLDEITLLDKTIAAFGPHSYIGPWLSDYRLQLVQDIESDLPPSAPMPHVAYQQAMATIAEGKAEAVRIRAEAEKAAQSLMEATKQRVESVRTLARRELERLAAQV